ncbi:MAG: hypothetical protein ACREJ3_12250, partial [Polyangiaceae bacterium]
MTTLAARGVLGRGLVGVAALAALVLVLATGGCLGEVASLPPSDAGPLDAGRSAIAIAPPTMPGTASAGCPSGYHDVCAGVAAVGWDAIAPSGSTCSKPPNAQQIM